MERALRLRKNEEFQRVYRRGKPAFNRDFKLIGFQNGTARNHYGFSLSKKFGKANVRNRMKRRLREIVRLNQDQFPKGFDFVVLPRDASREKSYQELEQSLLHCLRQWKKQGKTKHAAGNRKVKKNDRRPE